jgi:26S proteasome regulatory subunit T5
MITDAKPSAQATTSDLFGEADPEAVRLEAQIADFDTQQLMTRVRMFENNVRVMRSEAKRIQYEHKQVRTTSACVIIAFAFIVYLILLLEHTRTHKQIDEKIADNKEKLKKNTTLPYLIANVVEVLDLPPDADEAERRAQEGRMDIDIDPDEYKAVVVKTTSRQTVFLEEPGLVPVAKLKPGELVGVNKDSFLILEMLPPEYDQRVKAMEVDEKPTEDYRCVCIFVVCVCVMWWRTYLYIFTHTSHSHSRLAAILGDWTSRSRNFGRPWCGP